MNSNTSSFLLNSSTFHSDYYQGKEGDDDNGMIDLGLSLRTVQPEAYHTSTNCMCTFFNFLKMISLVIFSSIRSNLSYILKEGLKLIM